MKRKALFGLLVLGACGGSAKHGATPVEEKKPVAETKPAGEGGTVVVMPIASDKYPRLAAAFDAALKAAKPRSMTVRLSSVPMDTVQLQLECTDETSACLAVVARSLSADSLLFATIENEGSMIKAGVHLTTGDGETVKEAGATYKTEDAAVAEVGGMVDTVLEGLK